MEKTKRQKDLDSLISSLEIENRILTTSYSKLFDFCRDRVNIIEKECPKEPEKTKFYNDERGGVFTDIANLLSSNFVLITRLDQLVEKINERL
jgi:hypothetical protein